MILAVVVGENDYVFTREVQTTKPSSFPMLLCFFLLKEGASAAVLTHTTCKWLCKRTEKYAQEIRKTQI